MRPFFVLYRWDLLREFKRLETITSMVFFAGIVLFIFGMVSHSWIQGAQQQQQHQDVGAAVLWITVFFAGTIGLHRGFSVEQERDALGGLLTAPVPPACIYFAKVAAVGTYILGVSAVIVVVFFFLFDFDWQVLPALGAFIALAVVGYVALGMLLSAMTAVLRSGEVLLRILLLPALVPILLPSVSQTVKLFSQGSVRWGSWLAFVLAFDVIYLMVGWLLYEKLVEE